MQQLEHLKYDSFAQKKYIQKALIAIQEHYGIELVSLAIHGSFARYQNKVASDIDLLIVLEDSHQQSRFTHHKEFVEIEMLLLEDEMEMLKSEVKTELSPLILTKSQALHFNPLYLEMTENLILLFDKENFFQSTLNQVKDKMKRWGTKKIQQGNTWAWHLKPGLQWGEVIDYDK